MMTPSEKTPLKVVLPRRVAFHIYPQSSTGTTRTFPRNYGLTQLGWLTNCPSCFKRRLGRPSLLKKLSRLLKPYGIINPGLNGRPSMNNAPLAQIQLRCTSMKELVHRLL